VGLIRARNIDRSNIEQGHGDLLPSGIHRQVLKSIGKTEFEAQITVAIAIIVDLDLVDGLRVKIEVVRTAVGILQRDVIGDKRYVRATSGLNM